MPRTLPWRIQLAYSVGHFQNDLMASMWFSYLLVYFHQVNAFDNVLAGSILLLGQVVDALATPLVGYESDATSGCCRYTKRKSWHLFVIGATSNEKDVNRFVYYAAFVTIFQIGWAAVQISHLSLIPDLTNDESDVAGLNGYRYAMTGAANLATYGIVWAMLSTNDPTTDLSKDDLPAFKNIALTVTGLGLVFSVIFHLGVPEARHHHIYETIVTPAEKGYGSITPNDAEAVAQSIEQSTIQRSRKRKLSEWFLDVKFYQVALVYMCTRLFVNLSQAYQPMYITDTIALDKATIANVPLTGFACSFLTATVLKFVDKKFGRVITYMSGVVLALGACTFAHFIPAHTAWMVYVLSGMIGIGGALMLITSLSFVADLIGDFSASGAFVYGAMSFTDKLANGVAVEIIQVLHPCKGQTEVCCSACEPFYRLIQTFVPGGAAALALIGLLTFICSPVSNRSPRVQLMSNPAQNRASQDEDSPNGCAAIMSNGSLPNTIVDVHREPSAVLNDGRGPSDTSDDDDDDDAAASQRSPLLRKSSRRSSRTPSEIC